MEAYRPFFRRFPHRQYSPHIFPPSQKWTMNAELSCFVSMGTVSRHFFRQNSNGNVPIIVTYISGSTKYHYRCVIFWYLIHSILQIFADILQWKKLKHFFLHTWPIIFKFRQWTVFLFDREYSTYISEKFISTLLQLISPFLLLPSWFLKIRIVRS